MNPIRLTKNWISYRRTFNQLNRLPNDVLNDIGLRRDEIRSIASRAYR